jgi:hypothetical protein
VAGRIAQIHSTANTTLDLVSVIDTWERSIGLHNSSASRIMVSVRARARFSAFLLLFGCVLADTG